MDWGAIDLPAKSTISPADAVGLMDELTRIAARACARIRPLSPATVARRVKDDQSPVTAADEASEAAILEGLARLMPDVPVISEESAVPQAPARIEGSFFIVDPLDGTKEFLAGCDEFTVLIGIVTDGVPIAGIVAGPNRGLVWRGVVGHGAERLRLTDDGAEAGEPIRARPWPGPSAVALVSRSHYDAKTDAFLKPFGPIEHEFLRLGAQVRADRGRQRRRLSAARHHLRMGRRRRPRRDRGGGRHGAVARGRGARVRPRRPEFPAAGLRRLGRSRQGGGDEARRMIRSCPRLDRRWEPVFG